MRLKKFNMDQDRPSLWAIKTWLEDTGADWCRHRDGTYQAHLELEGDGALDRCQDAADLLANAAPCVARFSVLIPTEALRKPGTSPRPEREIDGVKYSVTWSRLVREYALSGALGDLFGIAEGVSPSTDYAGLEVQWPSTKKESNDDKDSPDQGSKAPDNGL